MLLVGCVSQGSGAADSPLKSSGLRYRIAFLEAGSLEVEIEAERSGELSGSWQFKRSSDRVANVEIFHDAGLTTLRPDARGFITVPAGALKLRYRFVLRGSGWGFRAGTGGAGAFVVGGQAYLLRPVELGRHAPISLRFSGGLPLLPWSLDASGSARVFGRDLWDPGFHAFGGRRFEVALPSLQIDVAVIGESQPSNAELKEWIRQAGSELLLIWNGQSSEAKPARIPLTVVVLPGGARIPFGQVLRSHGPSVAIYVGAETGREDFLRDWVAVHELSHLAHPRFQPRVDWLTEGLATYYQGVARARSGRFSERELWLHFVRGVGWGLSERGGLSLSQLSLRMHELHRYRAVYWGGALFALDLDVELRRAGSSLDAVLGALSATGRASSLEDFSVRVDALAGRLLYAELAAKHLEGPALEAATQLFSRLGVDADDGSPTEGAVDSALRRAIAGARK